MLFKSDRIVVARQLRAELLDEIHGAHVGQSKGVFLQGIMFFGLP